MECKKDIQERKLVERKRTGQEQISDICSCNPWRRTCKNVQRNRKGTEKIKQRSDEFSNN